MSQNMESYLKKSIHMHFKEIYYLKKSTSWNIYTEIPFTSKIFEH